MIKPFKVIKIFTAVAASLVVLAAGWGWWNSSQLERQLFELREQGMPVSLAELAPPDQLLPSKNAATYLRRAASDLINLYTEIQPHTKPGDFSWRKPMDEDAIAATEQALQEYAETIQLLEQALACTLSATPRDYTAGATEFMNEQLEFTGVLRTAARVLDCQAVYLASSGNPAAAISQYIKMLKLARLHESEPTLVCCLINLAVRGMAIDGLNGLLQSSTLAVQDYQDIELALAASEDLSFFTQSLVSERAFGIVSYRSMPRAWLSLSGDWSEYLGFMQAQIDQGPTESHAFKQPPFPAGAMATMVIPAIQAARNAMNRNLAQIRCVRVLNHKLCTAAGTELELPASASIDPYTGAALLQRETPGGWTIYSVGPNGADDDGKFAPSLDVGIAPPD